MKDQETMPPRATIPHPPEPPVDLPPIGVQDLSSEELLLAVPRQVHEGISCPAVGGIPLTAKLGQGGMGAVYCGFHPRLGTLVAVKILRFATTSSRAVAIERFFRE